MQGSGNPPVQFLGRINPYLLPAQGGDPWPSLVEDCLQEVI